MVSKQTEDMSQAPPPSIVPPTFPRKLKQRTIIRASKSINSTSNFEYISENPFSFSPPIEASPDSRFSLDELEIQKSKRASSVQRTRRTISKPFNREKLLRGDGRDLIQKRTREYFSVAEKWEGEFRGLKQRCERLESECKKKDEDIRTLGEAKELVDRKVVCMGKEVEKTKADLKVTEELVRKLEEKVRKKKRKVEKLRKEFIEESRQREAVIEELKKKKRALKAENRQKVNELTVKVLSLNEEKKTAENLLKIQLLRSEENETSLTKSITDLKSKCDKCVNDIGKKSMIIDTLNCKVKTVQSELAQTKADYEQLHLENTVLLTHTCPKLVAALRTTRRPDDLIQSLWRHLLRDNESGLNHKYKKKVEAVISDDAMRQCTHITIGIGLQRLGFYISHEEALSLIAAIGPSSDPEDTQILTSDFIKLLERKQPYRLWEDVAEDLSYFRIRFARYGTPLATVTAVFSEITRDMMKSDISKILQKPIFNAQSHSTAVADYLLLGSTVLSPSTISDRLMSAIPPWKSFSDLKTECREQVRAMILDDKHFKKHFGSLTKEESVISLDDFTEIFQRHFQPITDHALLYIACINFKNGIEGKISISVLINYLLAKSIEPEPLRPMQPHQGDDIDEDAIAANVAIAGNI